MRLMTSVGDNKKMGADGERRVVLPKAYEVDFADVLESTTSSKLARAFLKKRMLKRGSTSGTTGSGEVEGGVKKRKVDPPYQLTGAEAIEGRLGEEDELKTVEDWAKFTVRNGEEQMSKMAARLINGICLGVVEVKAELEKGRAELEKKVARLKAYLAKEGKRLVALKASQEAEINEIDSRGRKEFGGGRNPA
ncbi:hypothetical protein GIB67_011304 [Kingdonia uniflora]|uniref:Uncharacterized protein n=1 Tax=Kingdonia uniflora TaxID=39325 RepID=A0A7J7MNM6_9MAGN|nr:hypothetical protein GIB67_011304 [Kingdonia uniflora]